MLAVKWLQLCTALLLVATIWTLKEAVRDVGDISDRVTVVNDHVIRLEQQTPTTIECDPDGPGGIFAELGC